MASRFMRVDEVARELDVSEAYAYKIIKKLNSELSEMGYITVAGKLNRDYSARIKIVHFKQTNDMSRKPSARNERSEWRALGFGA